MIHISNAAVGNYCTVVGNTKQIQIQMYTNVYIIMMIQIHISGGVIAPLWDCAETTMIKYKYKKYKSDTNTNTSNNDDTNTYKWWCQKKLLHRGGIAEKQQEGVFAQR